MREGAAPRGRSARVRGGSRRVGGRPSQVGGGSARVGEGSARVGGGLARVGGRPARLTSRRCRVRCDPPAWRLGRGPGLAREAMSEWSEPAGDEPLLGLQPLRATAAMLVRDCRQAILLVRSPVGEGWELPGGGLEAGESPRRAARREALGALGWAFAPGRLLCVDYARPRPDRPVAILHFLFEGPDAESFDLRSIRRPADGASGHRLVAAADAYRLLGPRAGRRVRHAVEVAEGGTTVYLEDGRLVLG